MRSTHFYLIDLGYYGQPYFNYYNYPYNFYGPYNYPPYTYQEPPGPIIAIGRPFRASTDGPALTAEVAISAAGDAARIWSQVPLDVLNDPRGLLRSASEERRPSDEKAVNDWALRGAGEHASIASFAVFTLQLMTNGAPPQLIRDALFAALDELNHAEVSFGIAALFSADAKTVEPSALPGVENLKLERNLKALALGAAKEGCIEESLSALELAADARIMLASFDGKDSLLETARETTWKIGIDESRHSVLAWRTLQWVCQQDAEVCEEVTETVVNPENMLAAYERRFPGRDDMKEAWMMMIDSLPSVLAHDAKPISIDCSPNVTPESVLKIEKGAEALAQHITRSVVCPMILAKVEDSATK